MTTTDHGSRITYNGIKMASKKNIIFSAATVHKMLTEHCVKKRKNESREDIYNGIRMTSMKA